MSSTADLSGGLPDNLGEMSPVLKVGHVGVGLAVKSAEVVDFTVVEQVTDNRGNVRGWNTCSDVLTISTTVGGDVVRVDADGGNGSSSAGKIVAPSQRGG